MLGKGKALDRRVEHWLNHKLRRGEPWRTELGRVFLTESALPFKAAAWVAIRRCLH